MSIRSVGGGGGSSRYHPYSGSEHHHHRSSREGRRDGHRSEESSSSSRSSRDHHRRHEREHREHRYSSGHWSDESRRRERGRHERRHHGDRHRDLGERVHRAAIPHIPENQEERIQLFSTHQTTYNDPRGMICQAISNAKKKILLKIYHINSEKIIEALVRKSMQIPICIHYQESPELESQAKGSKIALDKRCGDALLHKKTLLVDSNLIISGSANYTDISLYRDINVTLRIFSSSLYKIVSSGHHGTANIDNQQRVDYYPICRTRRRLENVSIITEQIDRARNSILLSMHTLTQSEILFSLERALIRGVSIKIIVDTKEKQLMSETLKHRKLSSCIFERTCEGTLHTKACCIDSRVLICGSANWTGGGLNKNLEDVFIFRPLTETQLRCFMELWKFLEEHSRPFFPDSDQPSTSST